MAKHTGGSAFPHDTEHDLDRTILRDAEDGMTLRDWFAGQALAGILGDRQSLAPADLNAAGYISAEAYRFADAMLKERAKE